MTPTVLLKKGDRQTDSAERVQLQMSEELVQLKPATKFSLCGESQD